MKIALIFLTATSLNHIRQDAETFANGALPQVEQFDTAQIEPNEQQKEVDALSIVKSSNNNSYSIDEDFLDQEEPQIETSLLTEEDSHIEKCILSDAPFTLNLQRNLNVYVEHMPEVKKTIQVCSGHSIGKKHYWKSNANKEKEQQVRALSSDPQIREYSVVISGGRRGSKYLVTSSWSHFDDVEKCNAFTLKEKVLQKEKWEEKDIWKWNDSQKEAFSSTPQCTFVKKQCIDQTPSKIISGREIARKCWAENFEFTCKHDNTKECKFLRSQNCTQIGKKCLQKGKEGCAVWEIAFNCSGKTRRKVQSFSDWEIFGTNETAWEVEYEPNSSFSQTMTTLSVFDEIQKELQANQTSDATQIRFFNGKNQKCSKSVAEDLMYDCCFSYSGLAKSAKLAKCTADEMALAEMREKGLCHYIGSYKEKFLSLWESRTEHSFCCFPTKLAKVFHEEARKQLGIEWGVPKSPNCRGLSQEEISSLDFTKMDFSEAFEDLPDEEIIHQKCEQLENRLRQRLD